MVRNFRTIAPLPSHQGRSIKQSERKVIVVVRIDSGNFLLLFC